MKRKTVNSPTEMASTSGTTLEPKGRNPEKRHILAENGRKKWPPDLVLALASGKTVSEAAQMSGVSARTIYRYQEDPEFLGEVYRVRDRIVDEAIGQLAAQANRSISTIIMLEDSAASAWVRLNAARAILELNLRGQMRKKDRLELEQLRAELQSLQKKIRRLDQRGGGPTATDRENGVL
jgi:hypothetical protein